MDFFEKQGYEVELIWGKDRGVDKAFSEIICRKENEDKRESQEDQERETPLSE